MRKNTLALSLNDAGNRVTWSAAGTPFANAEKADFWRLFMDDGYEREIPVHSAAQTGKVTPTAGGMDIAYDGLADESGRRYDVRLVVHVVRKDEELELWAEVENRGAARVNEIQLPFVDMSSACGADRSADTLYRASGMGERLCDPWKALEKGHTEYMAADYREIWSPLLYPRPSTMAWEGLETGGRFLYLGRHDEDYRICSLNAGIGPRNSPPRLILSACHYPMCRQGEKVATGKGVLALWEGDWRSGSDRYGEWARSTFFKPAPKPEWVKNFTGWQRVILRHQYGEVFWKYADLPRLYDEGAVYGLDVLMVFGWWKGRFDNGYPIYEPDPALGGAEGLSAAIAAIQAKGGRVALYTNGILMDVTTDYYKTTGERIASKDIDGNVYLDHYRFSNSGTTLRTFGYKTFAKACMSTPEWTERQLENGRTKLSFGADSIFYDQIGGHHCWLCFDEKHPHGPRADGDPKYRRAVFAAMRGLLSGDKALGSENTVDLFAPYLDYHHGCDVGNWYAENSFPQLFLRTFPETIMTNRFIHDCRADYKLQLNWAFAMGYRFDVSIYRGRVVGIAGEPEYADYIKQLIGLRKEWARFFYGGRFVVDTVCDLPAEVVMTEYASGEERLLVFVNKASRPLSFKAAGRAVSLGADGVACVLK